MPRIVLATGNAGKVRELAALTAGLDIEIVAQREFGVAGVEEVGTTFVENALLKARHATASTGLPAIADDSGLAVDALGGAPGVYSARYAGPAGEARANYRKLLEKLRGIPPAERAARFHCLLVLLRYPQDPVPLICTGIWEGHISGSPRGDGGFGYDPVFVPRGSTLTAAEMPLEEKNRCSHRARALMQLLSALEEGYLGRETPG